MLTFSLHVITLAGQVSSDFLLHQILEADIGIRITNKAIKRDSGYSDEIFSTFSGTLAFSK